jgi:hypothetical protein
MMSSYDCFLKEVEKARFATAHTLQMTEWAAAGPESDRGDELRLVKKTAEEFKQAHKDTLRKYDH